jgi:2-haloacid dehalogenase
MSARPLIVFDVNETLLDLETMEPTFARIFGDKSTMRLWFANFIMCSAALTVAGCYVPFTDIGAAVMKMLADTRGIRIGESDRKELTEKFSTMPPHPEVPSALRKLRDAGFRLFTLTDNLLEVQTRQLEHGGIAGLFERRFSADGVKHHKPSREAYAYVERELGVDRPSSASSPAIPGTRSAPSRRAGRRGSSGASAMMSWGSDPNPRSSAMTSTMCRRSAYHAAHGLGGFGGRDAAQIDLSRGSAPEGRVLRALFHREPQEAHDAAERGNTCAQRQGDGGAVVTRKRKAQRGERCARRLSGQARGGDDA